MTPVSLKVINAGFDKTEVQVAWASSLYTNDMLGFSFDYSDEIRKSQTYRKYPFAANDVFAFRNVLFLKNKQSFIQYRLVNPLWLVESYALTLIEKAK